MVVFGVLASGVFQQETYDDPFDSFFANVLSDDYDEEMAERSSYLRWFPVNFQIIIEAIKEGD